MLCPFLAPGDSQQIPGIQQGQYQASLYAGAPQAYGSPSGQIARRFEAGGVESPSGFSKRSPAYPYPQHAVAAQTYERAQAVQQMQTARTLESEMRYGGQFDEGSKLGRGSYTHNR